MMEQVSMLTPQSMPHPEPTKPDTTIAPPLYFYPLLTLIPLKTTYATFDHPQLSDLAVPTEV